MATLTDKQELFSIEIVKGTKPYESLLAAGYSAKNKKTGGEAASRLLKNSKIIARIAELREPVLKELGLTLESHLLELASLRDEAKKSNQFGAAITAEVARGKAAGVAVDKSEIKHVGLTLTISSQDACL